jgi:hypothetical protein
MNVTCRCMQRIGHWVLLTPGKEYSQMLTPNKQRNYQQCRVTNNV